MTVSAEGDSRGGLVYCEVEGFARELPAETLRHEGLFVPTTDPLPIDREVEIFLRSPAGEITVRALVVQTIGCSEAAAQQRSPGYGVLFLHLADAQREWISRTRDALAPPRSSAVQTRAPTPAKGTPMPNVDDAIERARAARRTGTTTLQRASVLAQLQGHLEMLKGRAPADILGVEAPGDVEAAHRAFLGLSKRYHPHGFARFDNPEITRLATEIFIVYKRAYAALRGASKEGQAPRVAVSDAPRALSLPAPTERAANVSLRPERAVTPSMRPSMRAGAPRTSLAPGADPSRRIADAELLLASAVKHLAAGRFEQAEGELAKAAALAPQRTDIVTWLYVCRARMQRARGHVDDSLSSYRKVLELDPQNREAREAVEARADRRRGGLMSKWLGRGEE